MIKKRLYLLAGTLALSLLSTLPSFSEEAPATPAKESAPWEAMFPDGLIKAGQKASAAKKTNLKLLEGKFVGVYSSASWCGPCKIFTPRLVKFYKKNKKNIEIVFQSADNSEKAMQDYVKADKMDWLAVPFGKRANVQRSSSGIPNLVVYAPDGKMITEIRGASPGNSDPRLDTLRKQMTDWLEANAK